MSKGLGNVTEMATRRVQGGLHREVGPSMARKRNIGKSKTKGKPAKGRVRHVTLPDGTRAIVRERRLSDGTIVRLTMVGQSAGSRRKGRK